MSEQLTARSSATCVTRCVRLPSGLESEKWMNLAVCTFLSVLFFPPSTPPLFCSVGVRSLWQTELPDESPAGARLQGEGRGAAARHSPLVT